MADQLITEHKPYIIGDKVFYLWDDFDFDEKEWLDVIYNKLSGKGNEVSGSFTSAEILKTLTVILKHEDGSVCKAEEFRGARESLQVKIIADFFLSKAMLGIITTNFSKLSELEKSKLRTTSMN